MPSSIPQKRVLADGHAPAVPSPLGPNAERKSSPESPDTSTKPKLIDPNLAPAASGDPSSEPDSFLNPVNTGAASTPAGDDPIEADDVAPVQQTGGDHVSGIGSKQSSQQHQTSAATERAASFTPTPAAAQQATVATPVATRNKSERAKKDSLKKRESKAASAKDALAVAAESTRNTPDPRASDKDGHKEREKEQPHEGVAPMRYYLHAPKPTDFEPARGPVFLYHHGVTAPDGTPVDFYETSEHVRNKRNFRYTHCIADPQFPSSMYCRHTEPEPYGPHMSFEDSAMNVYFDQTARHMTTDKGFRTARANVCVREGTWFWECRITHGIPAHLKKDGALDQTGDASGSSGVKVAPAEARGHVRIGFSRREASLDAPVGFDAYGYGIRDVAGQKVWMSRPKDFFPPGEDLREGDVIGLEIKLPSEQLHRKVVTGNYNPAVDDADKEPDITAPAPNIVRDRIPISFKSNLYFERIDYHPTKEVEDLSSPVPVIAQAPTTSGSTVNVHCPARDAPNPNHVSPSLRTLPSSYIKVYKNGVCMGTAFENLLAFLPPASMPSAQVGARDGFDDGMLGYYPSVSVFRGGAAEVNFGPRFWYPPPGCEDADDEVDMVDAIGATNNPPLASDFHTVKPVTERFLQQIVEDVVYDMIDEVDFYMRDMASGDGPDAENATVRARMEAGDREIKELVQDD